MTRKWGFLFEGSGMKKCLNCGYERQPRDESTFISTTDCPKCHAIYEKGERLLLKKEYEKAEEWLAEKEKGRSQDGDLSDDDFGKAEDNYYNQGCKSFDAGYYENAVEKFTKALQRDPSHAKALANRGIAYRKLKRNIEATADLKKAELLGSTVAKDHLLKSRSHKIILGAVAAIVVVMILIAWQNNNEKTQREEMQNRQAETQRQEAVAAEQARVQAEQKRSSFQEEYRRESEKKRIHDMVYGDDDYRYRPYQSTSPRPLDDPMTRMKMGNMESKVRDLESNIDDLESKLRREKSDREFDKIRKGEY